MYPKNASAAEVARLNEILDRLCGIDTTKAKAAAVKIPLETETQSSCEKVWASAAATNTSSIIHQKQQLYQQTLRVKL